jgi:hypothetical protein
MAVKIFISYRRNESAGFALPIQQRLVEEFGRDLLFIDVDSIDLGRDFAQVIRDAVNQCGALLALMASGWVNIRANGKRRLDDAADFVRIEIAVALKRRIRVIPILRWRRRAISPAARHWAAEQGSPLAADFPLPRISAMTQRRRDICSAARPMRGRTSARPRSGWSRSSPGGRTCSHPSMIVAGFRAGKRGLPDKRPGAQFVERLLKFGL